MIEDCESKLDLTAAQEVITKLEQLHSHTKYQKNLITFKIIGTGNLLSVKDQINLTRREILKTTDSWHTSLLRIYLGDVFVQLESVPSSLKELLTVHSYLEGEKFKKVPYGYILKSSCLIQTMHAMSKQLIRYK
jgi:hypothetical protein